MTPAHSTRAAARTAALARAHADVTSRHPLVLAIALGAVLSVAIVTSSASSAAAAVEDNSDGVAALIEVADSAADAGTSGALSLALPLAEISEDAAATLEGAQTALQDAQDVTADVAASDLTLETETTSVDTSALQASITALSSADELSPLLQALRITDTTEAVEPVTTATEALREALTTAQEKKAAAEAAAAKAAAELAAANTVAGAKATAKSLAASEYGWGDGQFSCLVSLWNKESGWNYQAYNPSGATGIPQALPGSKMATAGSDWKTNATTQIKWGLSYIDRAYGSPCAAWSHSQATNWY